MRLHSTAAGRETKQHPSLGSGLRRAKQTHGSEVTDVQPSTAHRLAGQLQSTAGKCTHPSPPEQGGQESSPPRRACITSVTWGHLFPTEAGSPHGAAPQASLFPFLGAERNKVVYKHQLCVYTHVYIYIYIHIHTHTHKHIYIYNISIYINNKQPKTKQTPNTPRHEATLWERVVLIATSNLRSADKQLWE